MNQTGTRFFILKTTTAMRDCLQLWKTIALDFRGYVNWKVPALLLGALFVSQFSFAQATVKGKVTSGDSALSNVTVQVKGTNTFTQTDNRGEFAIAAGPTTTLVFTSIGYAALEMPVNNRTTVDVQLIASSSQL